MSNFLDSLISHWKCDEGAAATTLQDSHGSHDCAKIGVEPTVETGILNGARGFPAAGTTYQQVIATESTELNVRLATMPSFAYGCWFKITANQAWHFLGSLSAGAGERGWLLQYDNGAENMRIGVYDSAEALTVAVQAMVRTTGVWHYIYCGFDADAQKLVISVDGAAAQRDAYTDGIKVTLPGPNFAIGGTITGGNNAFGDLDEISFWRTIHSDADIAALYNSGTPTDISTWTASPAGGGGAGQGTAQLSAGRAPLVARHLPVSNHLYATFLDKPDVVVPAAITVVSRQIKD